MVYGGHGSVLELECSMCSEGSPCNIPDPSSRDCPNMKEVGGGMDGERYRCAVCGKGYYLDYEEMR
jgi:transposase-like protein